MVKGSGEVTASSGFDEDATQHNNTTTPKPMFVGGHRIGCSDGGLQAVMTDGNRET